jgi:hypothetical protein
MWTTICSKLEVLMPEPKEPPKPKKKKKKTKDGDLPEGFSPAKKTFKEEGLG